MSVSRTSRHSPVLPAHGQIIVVRATLGHDGVRHAQGKTDRPVGIVVARRPREAQQRWIVWTVEPGILAIDNGHGVVDPVLVQQDVDPVGRVGSGHQPCLQCIAQVLPIRLRA